MTTSIVENGKVTLNVTLYAKEDDSETIFLLHGGPGVPDPMSDVALRLSAKYQVIYFEQRGTGTSKNPDRDYTMESYVEDIESIAEHFQLTKFHIFGHSWGGLYAQIYASVHPERIVSLFLCSPSSGTNHLWTATENEVLLFNRQHASTWEFLKLGWYSLLGMLGTDSAYQNLFEIVLTLYHRGHATIDIDRSTLQAVKADPINLTRPNIVKYKLLETVENPTYKVMITYGDDDIYGSSKSEVFSRYPSCQHFEIENCGHLAWIHNPTRFGTILDEFYALESKEE